MVPHVKTPILNCFSHLLWFYALLTLNSVGWPCLRSHILCLAHLLCPRFPTHSIVSKRVHMKCLVLAWEPESCQLSHKIIYLLYKSLDLVSKCTSVYLQPLLGTHVLIVEGLILI